MVAEAVAEAEPTAVSSSPSDPVPLALTHEDPLVARMSEVVGGPIGLHAGVHPWWTPRGVLLAVTAATVLIGSLVAGYADAAAPRLATLAVLTLLALATTWLLTSADPGWGAAGWAASPLLLVHVQEGRWLLAAAAAALTLAVLAVLMSWSRLVLVAGIATILGAVVLLALPDAPAAAALVLMPYAALGVRRWRDLLLAQGALLLAMLIDWWTLAGALAPSAGGPDQGFTVAAVVRVAGLVWLTVAAALALAMRHAKPHPSVPVRMTDVGSGDDGAVELGGGEAHPDVDLLTDGGHPRP